jgi:selenocysteine-specific elongation factor
MTEPGSHLVVGTAGHVDHGKTALVRALTGVDCDRLPEEKARGITIELGFAHWRVAEGLTASVVDVPGHERFVRTMVAGASGIDCVVLVVAADDGVMPQTREHLAICQLLGVSCGVIAVTKCDLATSDLLELVEEDVRSATEGTFLASSEIVRCSAPSAGAPMGLAELSAAVARAWGGHARGPRRGPAFLAVDRAFRKAGAGTVVTGTLARGTIAVGDEVDALVPGELSPARLRVRAVEVHGRAEERVSAATRLALNLRGDDVELLARGAVIGAPDTLVATNAVDASLDLLPQAAPLGRRTALRLHVGTTSLDVSATLLEPGRERLEPGGRGFVRFTSRVPVAAFVGQHFVVRRAERDGERTVGGGTIVDPSPRPRRASKRQRPFFFEAPDATAQVGLLVADARFAGITLSEAKRRCSTEGDVEAVLEDLLARRVVACSAGRYYAAEILDVAKSALVTILDEIHAAKPLLAGVSSAELSTRSPPRVRALATLAIEALVSDGAVVTEGGLFRSRAHAAGGASARRQDVLSSLAARYRSAGLTPPLDDVVRAELALSVPSFHDAVTELKRAGSLRLLGGLHYDTNILSSLRDSVRRWFAERPSLTPVEFKELCGGITRKHAIPLLEWLDASGVTVRRGEARVPGPALGA